MSVRKFIYELNDSLSYDQLLSLTIGQTVSGKYFMTFFALNLMSLSRWFRCIPLNKWCSVTHIFELNHTVRFMKYGDMVVGDVREVDTHGMKFSLVEMGRVRWCHNDLKDGLKPHFALDNDTLWKFMDEGIYGWFWPWSFCSVWMSYIQAGSVRSPVWGRYKQAPLCCAARCSS